MKKNSAFRTAAWILAIAAVLANLAIMLQKDNIIIYQGLAFYRNVRMAAIISALVLIVLAVLVTISSLPKKDKKQDAQKPDDKAPSLSVKEKLSNSSLRSILLNEASGKWGSLAKELAVTVSQLEMMDSYQERLHNLLKENDVKALSDTEDILDQAEQYLCQNVRQLINYMNVFDESDADVVRASVEKTNEKNAAHLAQVRDFLKAVTDFVNQQGSGAMDPDVLKTYKEMILETVQQQSTGLMP